MINIETYIEIEKSKGIQISKELLNSDFYIKKAAALYPEYELKEPFGLHRPGVNIGSMMFIFKQIVAYVPPMTRDEFPMRFGIPYETFIEFCYPNDPEERIIYPILNHPHKYRIEPYLSELREILLRMPPTWERWHKALYHTGGNYWFDRADEKIDYRYFWNIPELRNIWRERLRTTNKSIISKEIKQQIKNNYVDLCLVGFVDDADRIAENAKVDAEEALNELYYISDLKAYPFVMGAGGHANIRVKNSLPIIKYKDISKKAGVPKDLSHFDGKVLDVLFEGLKFNKIPKTIRKTFLLEWHKSEQAKIAREAYSKLMKQAKLNNPSFEDLHKTISSIVQQLEDFNKNAEPEVEDSFTQKEKLQKGIDISCTIGGLAATVMGLFFLEIYMAVIGGSLTVLGAFNLAKRHKIEQKIFEKYAPNIPYEIFTDYNKMREFREKFLSDRDLTEIPKYSKSTSVPVRTFWWNE